MTRESIRLHNQQEHIPEVSSPQAPEAGPEQLHSQLTQSSGFGLFRTPNPEQVRSVYDCTEFFLGRLMLKGELKDGSRDKFPANITHIGTRLSRRLLGHHGDTLNDEINASLFDGIPSLSEPLEVRVDRFKPLPIPTKGTMLGITFDHATKETLLDEYYSAIRIITRITGHTPLELSQNRKHEPHLNVVKLRPRQSIQKVAQLSQIVQQVMRGMAITLQPTTFYDSAKKSDQP